MLTLLLACSSSPSPLAAVSAKGIATGTEDLKLNASDGGFQDHFGYPVAGAGDVDGFPDTILGANSEEAAYVYYGSATGLDASTEQKLQASDGVAYDYFGWGVGAGGDIDGDGFDDVLVGAGEDGDNGYRSGSAYVYYGSATGIDDSREQKLLASDGDANDDYANVVVSAGDLSADVVFTADGQNSNSGAAYVYYGSATGLDASTELQLDSDTT
ncbi:MAG: hypothetical protein GY884_15140, partial [Proteobacteria bacterium]|nr:hypothetical protein [Pseudomonadota bacterium]